MKTECDFSDATLPEANEQRQQQQKLFGIYIYILL